MAVSILCMAAVMAFILGTRTYGDWLYKRLPLKESACDTIKYLNPGKNYVTEQSVFLKKKLYIGTLVFGAAAFAIFLYQLCEYPEGGTRTVESISRPGTGQGERQIHLEAAVEGEKEQIPVTVAVKERIVTEQEAEDIFAETYSYLKSVLLMGNASFDMVQTALYLPDYVESTGCRIYWYSDSPEIINQNGEIRQENLEYAQSVCLTAELSYGQYEKQAPFSVTAVPILLEGRNLMLKEMGDEIQKAEGENRQETEFLLPKSIGGKKVNFTYPKSSSPYMLLLLGGILSVLMMLRYDRELDRKKTDKETVLMLAYPEIVSKLILLIGAGMTVRKAWERIVRDYQAKGSHHYAYEEMEITYFELERGLPEGKAYKDFGSRCRIHSYRKLGSVLEQNLKRGTGGLMVLLEEEAEQAFEERKALAVRLSEEAGTKLLLPMLLMLGVVLAVCVAPALMSF